MNTPTIYYADPDPLFNELVSPIPEETSRHHDLLVEIGSRIEEAVSGYAALPAGRRQLLSDKRGKYGKK